MDLYEKIKLLANEKKISIRQLEEALGFGNGVINRWRKNNPGIDKVQLVADYFDVSVDYLLGREESNSVNSFFRINTSNLDPDIKEEVEEELRNYSEFLIKKALEKKAKRTK
ncbi:helix-turn-helix transcriptional regulator [Enterococcus gallinarum]|uniref:helix-turn-helix domain-containing protein n=1 Tax=Enterococcus gallinarum TaxID=1353 RepID=UPI0032E41A29